MDDPMDDEARKLAADQSAEAIREAYAREQGAKKEAPAGERKLFGDATNVARGPASVFWRRAWSFPDARRGAVSRSDIM